MKNNIIGLENIVLYLCNTNIVKLSDIKHFSKKMSGVFNEKNFSKYSLIKDKKHYFLSSFLIYKFLNDNKINKNDLVRRQDKKPYIKNNLIYFSISHSGKYVCLVSSNQPVGLDIQQILQNKNYMSIAEKLFSKQEIEQINSSKNKLNTFYKFWCHYESKIKLGDSKKSVFYLDRLIDKKYHLSICHTIKDTKIKLVEIKHLL